MAKSQDGSTESPQADTSFSLESGTEAIFGLLSDDLELKPAQAVEQNESDEPAEAGEDADTETEQDEADGDGDESEDAGDDEAADEATDEPAGEDVTYKVRVDGEEIEVTLDEALRGYQRQQAFTRKTQALAEERKQIQATAEEVAQKRQEYLDRLSVVTAALKGGQEPDWAALKRQNPVAYAEQRTAWQERREQIEAIEAEQARVRTDLQTAMEAEREKIIAVEAERLEAAIPEWAADPDKARADKQRLAQFAENTYGFTTQDLGSVVDHRVILLLRDAMLGREAQDKSTRVREALKGTRKKSPTLAPGTTANKQAKNKGNPALTRLKRSGRIDDAAAAFLDFIE
jgi:hypothetical protein